MAVICSDPTTGAHTRIAYLHACTDSKTKSMHEENNVAVRWKQQQDYVCA